MVYYYRASPDRRRILFGGRVSHGETDPRVSGPRLHAEMVRIFPLYDEYARKTERVIPVVLLTPQH